MEPLFGLSLAVRVIAMVLFFGWMLVLEPSFSTSACDRLDGVFLQNPAKVVKADKLLGLGAYWYLVGGGRARLATLQIPVKQM